MRLNGITADTGFLIGLERNKQRSTDVLAAQPMIFVNEEPLDAHHHYRL
jgi:hypothetical protein